MIEANYLMSKGNLVVLFFLILGFWAGISILLSC